jgi:hypothetical protein
MIRRRRTTMKEVESFSYLIDVDHTQRAERELSAFSSAVTGLFGREQARVSTEDWLEEAELADSLLRPTERDWRSVTIAAAARLANRIDAARHPKRALTA